MADFDESHVERIFQIMLEEGAIELTGMSDDGEPVYRITPECASIFPEFFKTFTDQVSYAVHDLWMKNIVGVSFDDNLETLVYFDETHLQGLSEHLNNLTDEQATILLALGAPIEERPWDQSLPPQ